MNEQLDQLHFLIKSDLYCVVTAHDYQLIAAFPRKEDAQKYRDQAELTSLDPIQILDKSNVTELELEQLRNQLNSIRSTLQRFTFGKEYGIYELVEDLNRIVNL